MTAVPFLFAAASARDLGYAAGQVAFYVLLVAALVALGVWLWRRRR